MDRRNFVRLGVAAASASTMASTATAARAGIMAPDAVLDAGVREQQALMEAGKLTSTTLVQR